MQSRVSKGGRSRADGQGSSRLPESCLVRRVVCISRTAPFVEFNDSRYEHWSIDLMMPPKKISEAIKKNGGSGATQAHFFAYIGKESEEELIKANVPLFQNVRTTDTHGSRRRSALSSI